MRGRSDPVGRPPPVDAGAQTASLGPGPSVAGRGTPGEEALKIYRRDAFLALPAGTFYAKGKPWNFGGLSVKGRTLDGADGRPSDWFGRRLATIAFDEPRELFQRFAAMLKTGESYPLERCDVRDGTFQPDDLFLVYEAADLRELRGLVDAAIEAAGAPEAPTG